MVCSFVTGDMAHHTRGSEEDQPTIPVAAGGVENIRARAEHVSSLQFAICGVVYGRIATQGHANAGV